MIYSKILKNKIFQYLTSKYLTYIIQFVTSILIAVKLDPYYFGIWGFILLAMNYFRVINFGISNAASILLVQNRSDNNKSNQIIRSSFLLIGLLSILILIFGVFFNLNGGSLFEKFKLGSTFYIICVIAILTHLNTLFMNIFRVKNKLWEIAFFQSIIPLIVFCVIFFFEGEVLLKALLSSYVIGNLIALIVFISRKTVNPFGKLELSSLSEILNKGIYLFLYNVSFYLIVISIRTFVSYYYSVEEFGYFTFSFTLANSILLLLQALTFIIFPKIIDKLKGDDPIFILDLIKNIRTSYVNLAFGLVFLANVFFPFLDVFIPKYKSALLSLQLISLTVVLYTNSFGFGTYLMAQNKEKTIALIAIFSLIVNIIIGFILVLYFEVPFSYVILATNVSYLLFTFLCVYMGLKFMKIKKSFSQIFSIFLPFNLLAPYLLSVIFVLNDFKYIMILPFLLFVILNLKPLKSIVKKIRTLMDRPNIIDL